MGVFRKTQGVHVQLAVDNAGPQTIDAPVHWTEIEEPRRGSNALVDVVNVSR